jgi:hypothetical protein
MATTRGIKMNWLFWKKGLMERAIYSIAEFKEFLHDGFLCFDKALYPRPRYE